ncbi:hypothetical protein [Sulfurovum sp.]|uniref:hypothetical protein n=1 Tax=Sulfurovum sp. TaxID=1969726 RepID=UPI0035678AD0
MKKYMFMISVLISIFSLRVNAAGIDSFIIVYGDNHVYELALPKGWKLDKEITHQHKLGTFIYPSRYANWQQIPTYIHSTGYDKNSYKYQPLASFIEDDKNTLSKANNVKAYKIGEVNTYNSGKAIIYQYLYIIDKNKIETFDEVAYIDTPTAFCNVTFSTNNVEDLDKYQGLFNSIVASFNYLGDDLNKVKDTLSHQR